MQNNNSFFITSTGTEMGKTYITVKLIEAFLRKKISVDSFKPILSGFDRKNMAATDSGKLLRAGNKKPSLQNIKKITPWLYRKPIAPSLAAKYENKNISFKEVRNWCLSMKKSSTCKYLIYEGAGGLMVPIERKKTFIDLFKTLRFPVVLVAGSYLGTISHTLSALENLQNNNINIINIILNEGDTKKENYDDNFKLLKDSMKSKVLIRSFSNNPKFHKNEINIITDDIIRHFIKMA